MTRNARAALIVFLLSMAAGCSLSVVRFYAPREPAWGYTSDDGRIYLNESRPMCQVHSRGGCRELVLGRGGDFYWMISLADDPVWVGSTAREDCEALRTYVWERMKQRSSECTRVQLLLE